DGEVLADSQPAGVASENQAAEPEVLEARARGEGRSRRRSTTMQRDVLFHAVRYNPGPGRTPLTLRFALPLETVDEILASFRERLGVAPLAILIISGGAALLVSRTFTGRVDRLKEFPRRVAEGDFRPLPSDNSGDALQALCTSLNQTASRLDRTIRTLT